MTLTFDLADAAATEALGAQLARCLPAGGVLFLRGELGAGKTTLVRGLLRALGHAGIVKSPTYTLVEPYETAQGPVYHFDLYRLADAEELEFMGARDFFGPESRCLLEWPERGAGFLPPADVTVALTTVGAGRRAVVEAGGARGESVLRCLATG
jgi:tRNA threonylcarbamoyladenosine biosynthesis protein TsaE